MTLLIFVYIFLNQDHNKKLPEYGGIYENQIYNFCMFNDGGSSLRR